MKGQVLVENSKKQKKRIENIILGAVLAIIVIIGAGVGSYVYFNGGSKGDDFNHYLEIANQYVEKANYQEAIKNYWVAIEKNHTNERVYISLGSVYEAIDEPVNAINVYNLGYTRTRSTKLANLANSLSVIVYSGEDNGTIKDVVDSISVIEFNSSFLNRIRNFSYNDFVNNYGEPKIDNSNHKCTVSFNNGNITAYYYSTEQYGTAVDTATNTPKANFRPNEISLSRLSYIFTNMSDTMPFSELQKCNLSELQKYFDKELNKNVVSFNFEDCKVLIESDSEGNIGVFAWNRIYPNLSVVKEEEKTEKKFNVEGMVTNAVTGSAVENARVEIYNTEDMYTPVAEYETGFEGTYTLEEIPEGEYEIKVFAEGFIEEQYNINVNEWERITGINIPLSPELKAGEIRIVLTWNDSPRDLDSYLDGVSSNGSDVHISFMNKDVIDPQGNTIAVLDLDDTNGNGPETTTIYDIGGKYTFTVRDFTHSGTMAAMGATVKLYMGDSAPMTFEVPADVVDAWEVFSIDNGVVDVINSPTY